MSSSGSRYCKLKCNDGDSLTVRGRCHVIIVRGRERPRSGAGSYGAAEGEGETAGEGMPSGA